MCFHSTFLGRGRKVEIWHRRIWWDMFVSVDVGNLDMIVICPLEFVW